MMDVGFNPASEESKEMMLSQRDHLSTGMDVMKVQNE
jgi:hypothetical protein